MRATTLFLLGLLAACVPYEQRVAATCQRFGIGPDSPYYYDCIQRQMDRDSRDRAMWGGLALGGAALTQPAQPQLMIVEPGT